MNTFNTVNFLERLAKTAYYSQDMKELVLSLPAETRKAFLHNDAECLKKQLSTAEHFPNESHVVQVA